MEGLDDNLNQDLLATLSSNDQGEVDNLNNNIRQLKTENKKALSERTLLELANIPAIKRLNQKPKVARTQPNSKRNNLLR